MTVGQLRVTVLGCGGSLGVPMVGNVWGRCDPANPRNRRRRPAIMVETEATAVLIDTPPDLRQALLEADVRRIDAVFYTHAHADHVHGIDDIRALTFTTGPVRAYADARTRAELEARFGYAMSSVETDRGSYPPLLQPETIEGPFRVNDLPVVPFVQDHGWGTSLGFRFGPFAYSTDVVRLDDAALAALDGVELWMVDATRIEPHPSHSHLERTLGWIASLQPRQAYLTHMNHTMDYGTLRATLPGGVEPAYDGLQIDL